MKVELIVHYGPQVLVLVNTFYFLTFDGKRGKICLVSFKINNHLFCFTNIQLKVVHRAPVNKRLHFRFKSVDGIRQVNQGCVIRKLNKIGLVIFGLAVIGIQGENKGGNYCALGRSSVYVSCAR